MRKPDFRLKIVDFRLVLIPGYPGSDLPFESVNLKSAI